MALQWCFTPYITATVYHSTRIETMLRLWIDVDGIWQPERTIQKCLLTRDGYRGNMYLTLNGYYSRCCEYFYGIGEIRSISVAESSQLNFQPTSSIPLIENLLILIRNRGIISHQSNPLISSNVHPWIQIKGSCVAWDAWVDRLTEKYRAAVFSCRMRGCLPPPLPRLTCQECRRGFCSVCRG